MNGLYLALGAMTAQQTLATAGRSTVPLIAANLIAGALLTFCALEDSM